MTLSLPTLGGCQLLASSHNRLGHPPNAPNLHVAVPLSLPSFSVIFAFIASKYFTGALNLSILPSLLACKACSPMSSGSMMSFVSTLSSKRYLRAVNDFWLGFFAFFFVHCFFLFCTVVFCLSLLSSDVAIRIGAALQQAQLF